MSEFITRRDMLRTTTLAGAGLALAACGNTPAHTPQKTSKQERSLPAESYPRHAVMASVFYIGEKASSANHGIDNVSTEWETDARKQFGGTDNPTQRTTRGLPEIPHLKENPFYLALPASEFGEKGVLPGARERSPWANQAAALPDDDSRSLFKGRWVQVTNPATGETAYGQWLDTGPGDDPDSVRDYGYTFGDSSAQPKNRFGLRAGIDLSPALASHLGIDPANGSAQVIWQFADTQDAEWWNPAETLAVPAGPWRDFPAIDNRTHWE